MPHPSVAVPALLNPTYRELEHELPWLQLSTFLRCGSVEHLFLPPNPLLLLVGFWFQISPWRHGVPAVTPHSAAVAGDGAAFPQPCWDSGLGAGCVCTEWMSQASPGHQFTANQFSPACSLRCRLGGEEGACRGARAEGTASLHSQHSGLGCSPAWGGRKGGQPEGGREGKELLA